MACLADGGAQISEVAAGQDPVPAIEINNRLGTPAQQIRQTIPPVIKALVGKPQGHGCFTLLLLGAIQRPSPA
jgi:hypothetical protein